MAGHGRYPRFRLDSMPLDVAARKVSDRLESLFSAYVYVVPTSGIVLRQSSREQPTNRERYRLVGRFDRDASLMELAEALAPFVPIPESLSPQEAQPSKPCADCGAAVTKRRADGRWRPYCDPCARLRNARYDRANVEHKRAISHRSDPLNLALRDMPGFRSSLLGIAEAA